MRLEAEMSVDRHTPINLHTLADRAQHRHELGVWCATCQRWGDLDPVELTMRGHGARRIAMLKPRCRDCGSPSRMQLRAPTAPWPMARISAGS